MNNQQKHMDAIHRLGREEWSVEPQTVRRRVTTMCALCDWQVATASDRLGRLALSDHYRLRHPSEKLPPAA